MAFNIANALQPSTFNPVGIMQAVDENKLRQAQDERAASEFQMKQQDFQNSLADRQAAQQRGDAKRAVATAQHVLQSKEPKALLQQLSQTDPKVAEFLDAATQHHGIDWNTVDDNGIRQMAQGLLAHYGSSIGEGPTVPKIESGAPGTNFFSVDPNAPQGQQVTPLYSTGPAQPTPAENMRDATTRRGQDMADARARATAEAANNPFGIPPASGGVAAVRTPAAPSAPMTVQSTEAKVPGVSLPGLDKLNGDQSFLATLPPNIQPQVKAIAEGRMAIPSGMALKTPYWQHMIEAVSQYDPTFDGVNFNSRAHTRSKFTSGAEATVINKLNTAIGHAGRLYLQIAGTAGHSGFPLATTVNAFENAYNTRSGKPGVPLFKDTAGKLSQELTAVYRGSGGAEKDVVRGLESLDENASTETKKAIIQNAVDLLSSKLDAMGNQYNQGMGLSEEPFRLLNSHAQQVYQQLLSGAESPQSTVAPQPGVPYKHPSGATVTILRQ